ncbi:MAG: AbrB family transcriptional regulator [Fusobacteriales bacterium]|nr:MAG: AbrB family transcriptional regulator [Fusobacteriales bacterium]
MSVSILEFDKTISISSKNQITIPKKLMEFLNFGKEAKIKTDGDSLIISPIKEDSFDFSDLILEDLLKEGYSGEKLLKEFKKKNKNVKPAINKIIESAKNNSTTTEDIEKSL